MSARHARLSRILEASGVRPRAAVDCDPEVSGAALDSRSVRPGDIFFAIRGFQSNGEIYIPQAIERGARAIVTALPRPDSVDPGIAWVTVDQPRLAAGLISREVYRRPDEAMTLVGITGTNGKTTVAYMVESIARSAGRATGRIGTTGYAFGDIAQPLPHTTPEAPDLYRLLGTMRDENVEIVAMEVSSHSLALHRVEGMRFGAAAFLNLGHDHLDFHESQEAYFAAKARLFEELDRGQNAVLPADSPFGKQLAERTRAKVITFGRSNDADVRLRDERVGLDGSSAILETPLGALPLRSFLLGSFNLDNIAAAAACAVSVGLPAESIAAGVLSLERVPGRVEKIDRGQGFTVVVDYAHTEEALRNVLSWAGRATRGEVRVVFGCGGNRDRDKRFGMGQAAAETADRLYITSDNPRDEDPLEIMEAVRAGVVTVSGAAERCSMIEDRGDAIHEAIAAAEPGDVVVVAGKGHETTQTTAGKSKPFDDRAVAARALGDMGWNGGRHADV